MAEGDVIASLVKLGVPQTAADRVAKLRSVPMSGNRSYGVVELFGWPQLLEINAENPEPVSANLLIVGSSMDGRFIVVDLDRLRVAMIDQQDPDYPSVISETLVEIGGTLDDYIMRLTSDPDSVPVDYEDALTRMGRQFRWAD